jgi:hypothetical protein
MLFRQLRGILQPIKNSVMKKKILCLHLISMLCGAFGLLAQAPVVNNLCYDEAFTERLSVVGDVGLPALGILDKLKFRKKEYIKNHHEYFNSAGNAVHDVHFASHENMFPAWYTHPSTIRSDESGIKAYFAEQNEYLPDGWTGGLKGETVHGAYVEASKTKTDGRYLAQEYSEQAFKAYEAWNEKVDMEGFLPRFTFSYPSRPELKSLKDEGYDVSISQDIIQVQDTSINLVWDIAEKIFARQHFEAGSIAKTVKTHYEYNSLFQEDLIQRVITVTPGFFENGDCYETVAQVIYTNYSDACGSQDGFTFGGNDGSSEATMPSLLEVFPNPAEQQLSILIPSTDLGTALQIVNMAGEVLVHRQVDKGDRSFDIDISGMPSGIYLVKCVQGKDQYTSKFVKQ